jgi:SAM-dependent methyltransferase
MPFYGYFANRKKNPFGIWIHRRQARKLAKLVSSYLLPGARILEIGPGEGYFLDECLELEFPYKAVEGSREMAIKLKEKGLDVEISYVPPIPMEEQSVDACCVFHILEHMPDPIHAENLIDEISRIMTSNGLLFLACPNYYAWGRDFYQDDYTHNYITTPRRLRQLLSDKGYEVIDVRFYSGPIFGPLRYIALITNRMLYWKWLNRIIQNDQYYRGFITFLECFVMVARLIDRDK